MSLEARLGLQVGERQPGLDRPDIDDALSTTGHEVRVSLESEKPSRAYLVVSADEGGSVRGDRDAPHGDIFFR